MNSPLFRSLAAAAALLTLSTPVLADTWSSNTTSGNPIRTSTTTTKVGIGITGTATVKNMLDVEGAAVIGSSYSGTNTAPANGLLVQGNVGIGTTSPASGVRLDVNGIIKGDGSQVSNVAPAGSFSVRQYGALPNNTGTDYTTQFQNALNAAASVGAIVYIPPGQYTVNGNLSIPRGVTLQGAWQGPHDAQLDRGTTLRTTAGAGNATGTPFITLAVDAAVRGLTVFYPNQTNPASIQAYPYTIRMTSDGDVENVTLANSFQGIFATENSHFIRNVNMTAFSRGVTIDACFDIGRLENVHIHPKFLFTATGWAWSTPTTGNLGQIVNYTIRNLVGYSFGMTDWQEVNGCFVIWSQIGMQFIPGATSGSPNVTIVNSGVDVSQMAVVVNASEQWTGISFLNCQFVGQHILNASAGPVKYTNCAFHPGNLPENPNVVTALIWSDLSSTLSLTSCLFWDWDQPGVGHAAITMNHGVTFLSGCEFKAHPGKRHINLYNNANLRAVNTRFGHTLNWGNAGTGTADFWGSVTQ